jgi:hypothetical protein
MTGKGVGPALHLVAVILFSVVAAAAPVSASVVKDAGGALHNDLLGAAGGSVSGDSAACTASQCGLEDLKAAARSIAMSAGAKPAPALDHPPMIPSGLGKSLGSAALPTSANKGSTLEPALFALIAPSSERSQLCIEEGNLLGMQPNCKPPPAGQSSNSGYDCEHTDPRFGMKIACRIGRDVPEPGTPILLGIALLGLVATRAVRIARKGSAASL